MYPFYRHGAPPERDGDGAGPGDFYHQPTGKEGEILSGFSIALLIQSFDPTRNDGRCPPTGALSRGICSGNQCGQSRGKMPLLPCICLYPARRTAVQDANLTTTKGRCEGTLEDFYRTPYSVA